MLALHASMPPGLWKQKITALNCSKYFGEAVWYIQRKFFWLLKDFKDQMKREGQHKKHSLPHCSQLFCSVSVRQHMSFGTGSVSLEVAGDGNSDWLWPLRLLPSLLFFSFIFLSIFHQIWEIKLVCLLFVKPNQWVKKMPVMLREGLIKWIA